MIKSKDFIKFNKLIKYKMSLKKKRRLLDEQRQEEIRIATQKGEDVAAINKSYL